MTKNWNFIKNWCCVCRSNTRRVWCVIASRGLGHKTRYISSKRVKTLLHKRTYTTPYVWIKCGPRRPSQRATPRVSVNEALLCKRGVRIASRRCQSVARHSSYPRHSQHPIIAYGSKANIFRIHFFENIYNGLEIIISTIYNLSVFVGYKIVW